MSVGSRAPRVDGIENVTGQAKFTADLSFAGKLEAKVLRSPFPHAVVESIDVADVGKAVARATGVRIRELPLTPERVWRALKETRQG